MKHHVAFLVTMMLTLACVSPALAQSTGEINGRTLDSSQAVIPGSAVTAVSLDTGVQRSTTSNDQGYYTMPLLPPGRYRITARKDGFRLATRSELKLDIDQILRLDFVLEVGAITESVEVTAVAPLLQASDASLGRVTSAKAIVSFPLNGRNFQDLLSLGAGVVPTTKGTRIGIGDVSVGGVRYQANNYLLDGADNNSNIFNNQNSEPTTYTPPPDALGEFKVATNSYSAEYGRGGGAVINTSIRSGTNSFHGSLYEFLRNEKLDARNFFATQRNRLRRNQYGGTFGGPIVKNRSFLFTSYEGTRLRQPGIDSFGSVPVAAARNGDLSGYQTIYDPSTRNPFPGNRIPASRLDPVSLRLLTMYPEPNLPGLFRNYLYTRNQRQDRDKVDVRVDHHFRPEDSLFFRFSLQESDTQQELGIPVLVDGTNVNDAFGVFNSRSAVLGHTRILSASTLNQAQLVFHWSRADAVWGTQDNIAGQFGIPGLPAQLLAVPGMPSYSISGMDGIGGATFRPNLMRQQTLQIKDSFFHTRGAHTLKLGVDFKFQHIPFSVAQRAMGVFTFNGDFTRGPAGTGEGFGDFLLGFPQSFAGQSRASLANMRRHVYAGYVNDDWKVNTRLTLNLGVRYEFFTPLFDSRDRFASFDPATGKLRLATSGSLASRSLTEPDYSQLAPRGGVVFRLRDNAVIRAGYGMFFSGEEPLGAGYWLQNNPPHVVGVNLVSVATQDPLVTLSRGLPSNLFTAAQVARPDASGIPGNIKTAYVQNWNFTIQFTPGQSWSIETAYVGSKGSNFLSPTNINQALPGPGTVQARRPYADYSNVYIIEDRGKSNYHGWQTQVERRFAKGLMLLGSYTWSKAIDDHEDMFGRIAAGNQLPVNPKNLQLERGLSGTDIRHRATYNMFYELPFGRKRSLATGMPGWLNLVAGGWDVALISSFFSGSPFSTQTSVDACGCGLLTGARRPNRIASGVISRDERSIERWYDTGAFSIPASGTLGNAGRNILISPGSEVMDFSLIKNFQIAEIGRLEFRAEMFNFRNHANFGLPSLNIDLRGAGGVFSADPARQIQFGMKFDF